MTIYKIESSIDNMENKHLRLRGNCYEKKNSLKMAERFDSKRVLELLFDDDFDLPNSDDSKNRMQESLATSEKSSRPCRVGMKPSVLILLSVLILCRWK